MKVKPLFMLLNRVRVQMLNIPFRLMLVLLWPQTVFESGDKLYPANFDHVDVRTLLKLETYTGPGSSLVWLEITIALFFAHWAVIKPARHLCLTNFE